MSRSLAPSRRVKYVGTHGPAARDGTAGLYGIRSYGHAFSRPSDFTEDEITAVAFSFEVEKGKR